MKNDRLRVSVEDGYLLSLGRCLFVFASAEWNAVWCCERIRPGYIRRLGKKTAGDIAKDLRERVRNLPPGPKKQACVGPANDFADLAELRNGIVHGKPGTAPDGGQRLFKDGSDWTADLLDEAADRFAKCSIDLNALLYDQLKAP